MGSSVSNLQPGIFLDVQIGILCGDLPPDFKLRVEGANDPIDTTGIRCYSTDANAALHAAEKMGVMNGLAVGMDGAWEVVQYEMNGEYSGVVEGFATMPLALCAALIKLAQQGR